MEPQTDTSDLQFVEDLWDDAVADGLDPVERLVYRSNLLGSDWRITNTGGGNTSAKLTETDPITGETVEVLWVKGSGGDLRTSKRANFASLYQEQVIALQEVYGRFPERGLKTPAEDAMVAMYPHTTFNLNPRAPSIDTPLHSFIPYKHVDHMHPVAVIALATAAAGPEMTKKVYGDEIVWVDWMRPGFELGLEMQRVCEEHPEAKGILMGGHGLINWADDDKECYQLTLRLIDQAAKYLAQFDEGQAVFGGAKVEPMQDDARDALLIEVLPWLRGRLGSDRRMIATVERSESVVDFVSANRASELAELGTSCPDHFLRTKIKPLYVDWDPATGRRRVAQSRARRRARAVPRGLRGVLRRVQSPRLARDARRRPDRHPHPRRRARSAWGKSKSESRVTAEFYKCAIEVMRGAESVDQYTALPRQEAFDIEYWALEEAKLQRMPAEQALARRIAVVVGGGSGIGKELVGRLIKEGAVVAVVDLHEETAQATADETARQDRNGHRRGRDRHRGLRRRDRARLRHDRPRLDPRSPRPDDPRLRRRRPRRRHGGPLPEPGQRRAASPMRSGTTRSASTSPARSSSPTRRRRCGRRRTSPAASSSRRA